MTNEIIGQQSFEIILLLIITTIMSLLTFNKGEFSTKGFILFQLIIVIGGYFWIIFGNDTTLYGLYNELKSTSDFVKHIGSYIAFFFLLSLFLVVVIRV